MQKHNVDLNTSSPRCEIEIVDFGGGHPTRQPEDTRAPEHRGLARAAGERAAAHDREGAAVELLVGEDKGEGVEGGDLLQRRRGRDPLRVTQTLRRSLRPHRHRVVPRVEKAEERRGGVGGGGFGDGDGGCAVEVVAEEVEFAHLFLPEIVGPFSHALRALIYCHGYYHPFPKYYYKNTNFPCHGVLFLFVQLIVYQFGILKYAYIVKLLIFN